MDQFLRMLVSKLRVVFENASGEIEMWSKSTSAQIESQLRDRRRGFKRRREALERIQGAAGDLERRIAEVQAQDERLAALAGARARNWPTRCARPGRHRPRCDAQLTGTRRAAPVAGASRSRSAPHSTTRKPPAAPRRARCLDGWADGPRPRFRRERDRAWQRQHGRHDLPWQAQSRPLSRVAVGDHAAADAGGHGARLLRALPAALPRRRVRWPLRRSTTCWRSGAVWATTAARATCIAARRRSCAITAATFRAAPRHWRRCPASAARPRPRSRRSALASAPRSSTATSSAC